MTILTILILVIVCAMYYFYKKGDSTEYSSWKHKLYCITDKVVQYFFVGGPNKNVFVAIKSIAYIYGIGAIGYPAIEASVSVSNGGEFWSVFIKCQIDAVSVWTTIVAMGVIGLIVIVYLIRVKIETKEQKKIAKTTEEINIEVKQAVDYAESIQEGVKQLYSFVELPSFDIIETPNEQHNVAAIMLPDHTAMRKELVDNLCVQLAQNKVLLLYGNRQIGKSIIARLIAQRYPTRLVECRGVLNFQYIKVPIQRKDEAEIVVLDNLASDYVENAIELIATDETSTRYVLTTEELYDASLCPFKTPSIYQQEIPLLTEAEVEEIVGTYHPSEDIQPIVSLCTNHHPVLVQSLCQYLQALEWKYNYHDIELIIKGDHLNLPQRKVGQILSGIEDEARHLLNRILLFQAPFTDDEVIDLANIEPRIDQPRLRLQQIKSDWLSCIDGVHYQISPLLKTAWKPDLVRSERNACNHHLGYALIAKKNITDLEAVRAISYYNCAELYEEAGGIYVKILTSSMDLIPRRSLLNLLWVGVDLPKEMSVSLRLIIRISQLLRLKNISKEQQEKIYHDLMNLVDTEGVTIPNAGLAYRLMSSICFFRDDVNNGLRYYRMGAPLNISDNDEDASLLKLSGEIGSYMQSGLWFLLMRIGEMPKFEEWLHTYRDTNQGSHPLYPVDYAGCYFFVWRYIDTICKGKTWDEKQGQLDILLVKSKEYEIDALIIMILFKKMELFSMEKKYEQVNALYQQNMCLYESDPLAQLVFNASMGYALYREGNEDRREECLGYLSKSLLCPDKDILPDVRLHIMETKSYVESYTDTQLALRSMQEAYDYIQVPYHRMDAYDLYFAKGELVHAKWLAGEREAAILDLSECMEFVLDEVHGDSPFAKTYLCKCDCALTSYEHELSGVPLPKDMATPKPGMYTELSSTELDDLYTENRIFVSGYLMYGVCEHLKIADLKEKWLYKTIEYQRKEGRVSVEHGILQTFYPELLRKNDLDNAIYVCQVAIQANDLAKEEHEKNFNTQEFLISLQLMPMLIYAIHRIIQSDDYSAFERIHEITDTWNEKYTKLVPIVNEILKLPVEEYKVALYAKYEEGNSFPLYQVISALILINEETPLTRTHVSLCSIAKEFRTHCNTYYRQKMDWVFDEFVIDYWNKKIETHPSAFNGIERYQENGIAQIEREQANKARICLRNISFHVNGLALPSYIEDWLLD